MLDISKIKWYGAPDKEYYKEIFPKNQVVLHHTASGGNSMGDIDYLNAQPGRVHVAFWIDRTGLIWQAFSSKYWAPHLGTPQETFTKYKVNNTVEKLHKASIAIELDNWGYLTKKGDKYYSYNNTEVKPENIAPYDPPYRGQQYYERYYDVQMDALEDLLVYLCNTYNISKEYNCDMWDVSANALSGKNGIWTHVSYREKDKWDMHPLPRLVKILEELNSK